MEHYNLFVGPGEMGHITRLLGISLRREGRAKRIINYLQIKVSRLDVYSTDEGEHIGVSREYKLAFNLEDPNRTFRDPVDYIAFLDIHRDYEEPSTETKTVSVKWI